MGMETWRHGDMVAWRHGGRWHGHMEEWWHGGMETWRGGDVETWRRGNMEAWRRGDVETWRRGHEDIKRKTEGQEIFLNPFTLGSSCKRKFFVCPFVDEELKGSYLVVNVLNRLNGLAHLCLYIPTVPYIYICCNFKRKTKAQVIFLNVFTICSSCK